MVTNSKLIYDRQKVQLYWSCWIVNMNHIHVIGYDPKLGDDEVTGKIELTVFLCMDCWCALIPSSKLIYIRQKSAGVL